MIINIRKPYYWVSERRRNTDDDNVAIERNKNNEICKYQVKI